MSLHYFSQYGVHVSSDGVVSRAVDGYKYSQCKCRAGYHRVYVRCSTRGKRVGVAVHRLVAMAFIPNPHNLPEVNHRDGNKSNNHVSNLEWCSRQFNMAHAKMNGLLKGRTGQLEVTATKYKAIRELYKSGEWTYDKLADAFGVSKTVIGIAVKQ